MKVKSMKNTVYDTSYLRKKIPFIFLFTMFVLQSAVLFAQDRNISGTVVDESGEPVIGATVVTTGTNRSTITDLNGAFKLSVPSTAKTIEISYLGYNKEVVQLK